MREVGLMLDIASSNWRTRSPKLLASLMIGITYGIILLTKDVQEDAFITFRTAFNLADYGELSFNLGEGHNSATSLLYPLWIALLRMIFGSCTIGVVLLLNSAAVVIASALIARIARHLLDLRANQTTMLWLVIAISPVSLLMATRGMEAALIVLFISLGLDSLRSGRALNLTICIALLPLLRPDAVIFSGLLMVCAIFARKGLTAASLVGTVAGAGLYIALSFPIYGSLIPLTVNAKSLAHQDPDRSALGGLLRLVQSNAFAPFHSKYLIAAYSLLTVSAFVLSMMVIVWAGRYQRSRIPIVAFMVGAIWLPVIVFFVRGIVFPWYLWPSGFLYASLVWSFIVFLRSKVLAKHRVWPDGLILFAALVLALSQIALSFNNGLQESGYRASVGIYIRDKAEPQDTLFLEPAGYIPFYSGLRTIDDVGLTSPLATQYMSSGDTYWRATLIRDQLPSWLVLREPVEVLDSASSDEAVDPLNRMYCLERQFIYNPSAFSPQALLSLARLGDHSPYFLYRLGDCNGRDD